MNARSAYLGCRRVSRSCATLRAMSLHARPRIRQACSSSLSERDNEHALPQKNERAVAECRVGRNFLAVIEATSLLPEGELAHGLALRGRRDTAALVSLGPRKRVSSCVSVSLAARKCERLATRGRVSTSAGWRK